MHNSDTNKNKRAEEMIEEIAEVVSVGPGYADIIPQVGGTCSSCASNSSCSSSGSAFSFFLGNKPEPKTIRVQNSVAAMPGDQVIVGVRPNTILKGSVLAYLMPLLALVVFAAIGHFSFGWLGMNAEAGSILLGLFGLFAGFKIIANMLKRGHMAAHFEAVILRIKEPVVEPVFFNLST